MRGEDASVGPGIVEDWRDSVTVMIAGYGRQGDLHLRRDCIIRTHTHRTLCSLDRSYS